ncbi:MAG: J domain-containing protein [Chloroflexi bacterium]|nr:J domain-containing protein [Chloroflexota bacterium]
MEYRDYYASLGVPRTASQADIKKAFRKLAREHHPDVNKGDGAAERRFKEINEANAVLGDAEKRKAYDALGSDWETYQGAGASPGRGAQGAGRPGGFRTGGQNIRFEYNGNPEDIAGFSDFFRTFFGGGAGRTTTRTSSRTPGGAHAAADAMEFDDILSGFGIDEREGFRNIGGRGSGPTAPPLARDVEAETELSLEQAFHGTRRIVQIDDKRLDVEIPKGVDTGTRIRLSGQAGKGPGAGHLYLRITVREHPVFTRSGADLHRELPITLADAMLGAEVPVETIGGSVILRIPPETQTGRSFRLTGQGMPRFKSDGRGDLYAKTRVVLPGNLDEDGRRLLRAFADHVKQPDPRRRKSAAEQHH